MFRSIQDGAKLNRNGKLIERGVQMIGADIMPIIHDGPSTVEALWKGRFFDQRSVKIGTSKVTRTRPRFTNWTIECDLVLQADIIDEATFRQSVENAGMMTGLGDYRPRFGRFDVANLEAL